jgi:small-conductance mechanosensitive channel
MTEEVDALQAFDPLSLIALVVGLLALGIALEVGLRFARRWAESKEQWLVGLVLRALQWQSLFWSLLLAAGWLLAGLSDVSVERQRGLEIVMSLFLISLTVVAVRLVLGWFKMLAARRPSASVSILNYLINGTGVVIVLAVALYMFNVSAPLLLLTLLGSTLGLSLAFREPLSNLFAGVMLTASSRIRPGDFLRLPSGEKGTVLDIEWDVTTVRQEENSLVIVPNSHMAGAQIINYSQPDPEFELAVVVGVSYDSDLEEVERVTIEEAEAVVRDVPGGVPAPSPYIRFREFRDSDIKFEVFMNTRDFVGRNRVKHEFIKQLHRRYDQEGIVIPFPAVELHTPPGDAPSGAGPQPAGKGGG